MLRFSAFRFLDEFEYTVTFERTKRFHVVDISDEQPQVSYRSKVSGFSGFLHLIDGKGKMLLSVGLDTNGTGAILGYQVSLFIATDSAQPTLVVRNDENTGSWSSNTGSASWDERAFRLLPHGVQVEEVMVTMRAYDR
jgi:uncharacterized secreted protein with C-terminal beta-propeller domain